MNLGEVGGKKAFFGKYKRVEAGFETGELLLKGGKSAAAEKISGGGVGGELFTNDDGKTTGKKCAVG